MAEQNTENNSLQLIDAQQYVIKEIAVVTKGGERLDISSMMIELNIFDSILMPVMSGVMIIRDSIGLSNYLTFDGSESLLIHIKKDKNSSELYDFKRAFRIYKQGERIDFTPLNETYSLSFVSDELIFSDQQRVNQSYEMTYTEIVENILNNYLKVPASKLPPKTVIEKSVGVKKVVIPNLRPLEAIEWCAKRALDERQAPDFLFYENRYGFNFKTLTGCINSPIVEDQYIDYRMKNMPDSNPINTMRSIRVLEIVNQTDNIEKTRSGVIAGKFIGFDPTTRSIQTNEITYDDHFKLIKHINPYKLVNSIPNRDKMNNVDMYNSKKTVSSFSAPRKQSNYIKKYDPTSIPKEDTVEQFLFQRKAILKNLTDRRLKVTTPGNFKLTSGENISIIIPKIGLKIPGDTEENNDKTLSGKYLVIATRHILSYRKFETIVEVATSSSLHKPQDGHEQQTKSILEY